MASATTEVEELPRSIVKRVVKEKLSHLSPSDGGDFAIHKDALLAFSESARIFIHYLSATANDICKESKRQTINADDVLKALEEIEFPEFVEPLKASLDAFRKRNAGKKSAAKEKVEKKRKTEEEHAEHNKEAGGGENAEQDGEEEEEDPSENEE